MSAWAILWIAWVLAFFVIEFTAIGMRKWAGTLSDNIRALFRTNTRLGRFVWLAVAGGGMAWFLVHIAVAGSA